MLNGKCFNPVLNTSRICRVCYGTICIKSKDDILFRQFEELPVQEAKWIVLICGCSYNNFYSIIVSNECLMGRFTHIVSANAKRWVASRSTDLGDSGGRFPTKF